MMSFFTLKNNISFGHSSTSEIRKSEHMFIGPSLNGNEILNYK